MQRIRQPLEGVKYINYNEDEETVEELTDCLMNQSTLTPNSAVAAPLVLCLTPPGLVWAHEENRRQRTTMGRRLL